MLIYIYIFLKFKQKLIRVYWIFLKGTMKIAHHTELFQSIRSQYNTIIYTWAHQNSGSELDPCQSHNCTINAFAQQVWNCVIKAPQPISAEWDKDSWRLSPSTCTSTPALLMAAERRCVPRSRHGDAAERRSQLFHGISNATSWSQKGKITECFCMYGAVYVMSCFRNVPCTRMRNRAREF